MTEPTLETIRGMVELMRQNNIPPCIVRTRKEARRLTKSDPCGFKWKVGDEYYRLETLRKTTPIKP